MPQGDGLTLLIVGAVFVVLGISSFIWGKREEKSYFTAMSKRPDDLREFLDHWPPRPQPGALKIGGWIAMAIGVILAIMGFAA
ncbi:MAG: hypothetical protein PHR56_00350 [Dehalococcoidales bacterium]|nr:hypothetical protein [Dehalococcoidales bacterium]